MSEGLDPSLEALETKIAFLEHAVAELSDVAFRQQREMQALKAEIGQLKDRFESALAQEGPLDPALERPPHY